MHTVMNACGCNWRLHACGAYHILQGDGQPIKRGKQSHPEPRNDAAHKQTIATVAKVSLLRFLRSVSSDCPEVNLAIESHLLELANQLVRESHRQGHGGSVYLYLSEYMAGL